MNERIFTAQERFEIQVRWAIQVTITVAATQHSEGCTQQLVPLLPYELAPEGPPVDCTCKYHIASRWAEHQVLIIHLLMHLM